MKKLNVNVNGNNKLKNNENTRFMIWNLPAQKTCPFATEMCKKACYAKKAERVYPQVLPSRERNHTESLTADFVENMIFTIETLLNSKAFKNKKAVFRIHESGDFYNYEYTKKWCDIVKHFENDSRIVFLAYTKSIPFFVRYVLEVGNVPENLVVRASIWKDTAPELDFYSRVHYPIYTALTRAEMEAETAKGNTFTECRCSDCATCGKCWNKDEKNIICEIH